MRGRPFPDLVGKTWAARLEIEWQPHGLVNFPVPPGSELLLDAARLSLRRAQGTRDQLPDFLVPIPSPSPVPVRSITDPELRARFFRDAMAGVVLAHTALENWSADMIPDDLTVVINGQSHKRPDLVRRGLERRITQVAAAWSGRENLATASPDLLHAALALKELRDDVVHVRARTVYTKATSENAIFTKLLLRPSLTELADAVDQIIDHYTT